MKKIIIFISLILVTIFGISYFIYSKYWKIKIPINCVYWFDGCNYNEVENGKIKSTTLGLCYPYQKNEKKCLKFKDEIKNELNQQMNMKVYTSEAFSFQYPDSYSVISPTTTFPALIIKKDDKQKIEIFEMKDFGDRPFGFEDTETQENIDGYIPKEQLTLGTGDKKYDVWLYYNENDEQSKNEIHTIRDSITVPKNLYINTNQQDLLPLSYSTLGANTFVSKEIQLFDFTAKQLEYDAKGCGSTHGNNYFENLVNKFESINKIVYKFIYQGVGQDNGVYLITLVPNKTKYKTMTEFKKDFDVCEVGGDAYPHMLNSDWLVFVSSCGSGYSDESGRPNGCMEVKKVVEPSLKLN